MSKVSSYSLIAAADIDPTVDYLYIVDGSAATASQSRRALLSSLYSAASREVVETITASRTLTDDDHGKTLYYAGTSNITLTIPSGLIPGLMVRVVQGSSGKVTAAGSGVTVNGKQGQLATGGQWHMVTYHYLTASLYLVEGDTGNAPAP